MSGYHLFNKGLRCGIKIHKHERTIQKTDMRRKIGNISYSYKGDNVTL